jgi:TrmH family RNA methyltransferase
MLFAVDRARLAVILVGARNPSNIGAAARAMQDFGFGDLRIVNDYAASFEAAQLEAKSAVAAEKVLQQARRFDRLTDAIADCTFIVGTTAVGERELRQPVLPLREAVPPVLDELQRPAEPPACGPRVALLFGSEKTGLTNEQLSHCGLLTTIPLFQPEGARHLSMNLGQAVAVCLYELTREGLEGARPLPAMSEPAATAADRERLTQQLLDVMLVTGYIRRFPANSPEATVRQMAGQLGASHRQAMTWMGILRQVLWRERGENSNPTI